MKVPDKVTTRVDMMPKSGIRRKSRPRDGSMRSRFIDATSALLREAGISGASIRAICNRVGVKPPTLYHYFGDLETLRNSVVDTVVTEYFEARNVRMGACDPYTRLRGAWDNFVAFSTDEPFIYTLLVQQHFYGRLPQSLIDAHMDLTADMHELEKIRPLRYSADLSSQMFSSALLGTVAVLAGQNAGIPKLDHLSAVMREEAFRSILG